MLRKIVVSLCLVSLYSIPAMSQSIQWGVSSSVSIHALDFEEPLDFWEASNRTFPTAMLHMDIPLEFIDGPLGKILWLRSGARYTRLASRVDFETQLGQGNQLFTGAFYINQHYLAIPVQLRLDLGKLPVFLIAGPEFGILLFANRKSETFSPEESRSSDTRSITSDLRLINTSLYGGLGVSLGRGFALFGRYGQGVGEVLKGGERTVSVSDWLTKEFEIGLKVDFKR